MATDIQTGDSLQLGTHLLSSRLIVGTGKYASYEQMAEALDISGTDCITVAVRRERLIDAEGRNILDHIDTSISAEASRVASTVGGPPSRFARWAF